MAPTIFISYRRDDSEGHAGRLYDALSARYGRQHVFLDVSSIRSGREFDEAILQAITSCGVFLALLGPSWLSATDDRGRRRLDDAQDWVRLELEQALSAGVSVIPVLLRGARMPDEGELPESLHSLRRRQALAMTSSTWEFDLERLVSAIQEVTTPEPPARPAAPSGAQEFRYDAYVSYIDEEPDSTWVWQTLVPRMERAGLRVAVSGDLQQPGVDRLVAVEQGLTDARRTVVVLSPTYLRDNVADFENVLAQTIGVDEGRYRVLPVSLGPSRDLPLPARLRMLTIVELGHVGRHNERALDRLVEALAGPLAQRRSSDDRTY